MVNPFGTVWQSDQGIVGQRQGRNNGFAGFGKWEDRSKSPPSRPIPSLLQHGQQTQPRDTEVAKVFQTAMHGNSLNIGAADTDSQREAE